MRRSRKKGQPLTLRDRLIGSLTPAMIGAGLGFVYARETMDPAALEGRVYGEGVTLADTIAVSASTKPAAANRRIARDRLTGAGRGFAGAVAVSASRAAPPTAAPSR